jgi:hypothetical protein
VGEERSAMDRILEATLGAAPLVGSLGAMRTQVPLQTGGGLLNFGEKYNLSTATPQGRATTLLQLIAGMTPTAINRGNYQQQTSKGTGLEVGGLEGLIGGGP